MSAGPTEIVFERDIKEHKLLIYKVCRIYAYCTADREDLYQEIVLQLWNSYQKFRGEAKFSTWLYRVAINTAITGIRRQKKFIRSYEPSQLPVLADEKDENEQEQLNELYTAIEQLNQIEKAIVMLYLEDRSYEEMEEILGISNGTLRVKMNRIKEKLRQLTKNN
ncbi:MAG: RNA polymerase sigma factor [Bacteroidota bacterium]|nr:RNA polymerase sigma factor [Bacteroidota bacterium]